VSRYELATVAVVIALALAGCSGVVPSDGTPGATSPTHSETPTVSATPPPTDSVTPTPEPTATPTPEYEEPKPPNTPLEGKNHDDGRERLRSVEFVNAVQTDDGAYTNFDLRIHADTRMEDVDPASHGEFRNGTFLVDVHPGGLDQFEPGTLEMEVLLMDRDSEYDDVYGVWRTEFAYAGDETR
jgi:hypothetical protein